MILHNAAQFPEHDLQHPVDVQRRRHVARDAQQGRELTGPLSDPALQVSLPFAQLRLGLSAQVDFLHQLPVRQAELLGAPLDLLLQPLIQALQQQFRALLRVDIANRDLPQYLGFDRILPCNDLEARPERLSIHCLQEQFNALGEIRHHELAPQPVEPIHVIDRNVFGEGPADEVPAFGAEERCRSQVASDNLAARLDGEVPDGRKLVEVRVAFGAEGQLYLGPAELLVLHLELDLVYLQLVYEPQHVVLARFRSPAFGVPGSETLLRTLAQQRIGVPRLAGRSTALRSVPRLLIHELTFRTFRRISCHPVGVDRAVSLSFGHIFAPSLRHSTPCSVASKLPYILQHNQYCLALAALDGP